MCSLKKERCHARTIFEKMAGHTRLYYTTVLDKQIPVLPGVFSPRYVSDVQWFAREVPRITGKRSFLEIGTGTGVIALFVGLHGASSMLATDINARAVQNARKTFRLHGLSIQVRKGNVFDPIRKHEKFDVIFWDHPFHFSETVPKTMLERGGYDHNYDSLRVFFARAKRFLAPSGEILLGTSKNARLDLVRCFAREYGYRMTLLRQEEIPSERRKGVNIDVRIYSFHVRE